MPSDKYDLILASASPRRREMLNQMGVPFTIVSADIDETRKVNEDAKTYVTRLAAGKAQSVYDRILNTNFEDKNIVKLASNGSIAILSADTIVIQNEQIFGKPKNKQQAFRVWNQLSGTEHIVMTAVCLLIDNKVTENCVSTKVTFNSLTESQMERYWASGEPLDKAGAYAIQGLASAWVKQVHGSYSNVVGLPLSEVNAMLQKIELNWL